MKDKPSSLSAFLLHKNLMVNVDSTIKKILCSGVDKKNRPLVKYQIEAGGKRIRPALAIICCQLFGGKLKDVLYPAAGLEILHNYSLIFDDMIDNSVLRRGQKTVWVKFGKSVTECVGPMYAASMFQAVNLSKNPVRISELFAKTLKKLVDGEITDILFEQSGREGEPYVVKNRYLKITEKDYLKMVAGKTAALIQTACEVGGISAKASAKNLKFLRNCGFNLGMAFQIQDDILDIFGDEKVFAKKVGKDIQERKLGNIVILYGLKEFNKKNRRKFLGIIRKKEIKENDIKEGIDLLIKTKAKQKAEILSGKFIEKAKNNLKLLPQNKWNVALRQIADFVVERKK